jgi:hypothetical protein
VTKIIPETVKSDSSKREKRSSFVIFDDGLQCEFPTFLKFVDIGKSAIKILYIAQVSSTINRYLHRNNVLDFSILDIFEI